MTDTMNNAAKDGLRFFGRMSAAISHDLKNTLSIMNESAGLIEDLALLTEKGRPLDPQRIHQLGATIKRQIQRNDGIVRNMNQFAHSVDNPLKEISLASSLEMLLSICRRLTDARGIAVSVAPPDREIAIVTRPFYLYHLVWRLLEWSLDYAGAGKRLVLQIDPVPGAVRLVCRGLEGLTETGAGQCPPSQWHDLLVLLEGRIEVAADQQSVAAVLPQRIDA
ncbi:MAG: hypothetical protein R6W95_09720 [Desulfosarcina sp.]